MRLLAFMSVSVWALLIIAVIQTCEIAALRERVDALEASAPAAIVPPATWADLLHPQDEEVEDEEVRDEVAEGPGTARAMQVDDVQSSLEAQDGPEDLGGARSSAYPLSIAGPSASPADVETSGLSNEPTPLPGPGVSASPDEARPTSGRLSRAEVLSVLPSTSWPAEHHELVADLAWCESRNEVAQRRGDGGLAWGLLSVRSDVHVHLLPLLAERSAWADLEAGWRVYADREAIGWSGWGAWATCYARATAGGA